MDIIDYIKTLRKGHPDVSNVRKASYIISGICLYLAITNIMKNGDSFFEWYTLKIAYVLSALFAIVGILFLFSSFGLFRKRKWGIRLTQVSIFLFSLFVVTLFMIHMPPFTGQRICLITYLLTVSIPLTYYTVGYIGRLLLEPLENNTEGEAIVDTYITDNSKAGYYCHSPLPFGYFTTGFLLLLVFTSGFIVIERYKNWKLIGGYVAFFIIFGYLGEFIFKNSSSPFQERRTVLYTFNINISMHILLRWSSCRVLIYRDGFEFRVSLHRFFIPYEKIKKLSYKKSYFVKKILIQSNLPGVPNYIRFSGFKSKNMYKKLKSQRSKYFQMYANDRGTSVEEENGEL